jgi:hypothetical protein
MTKKSFLLFLSFCILAFCLYGCGYNEYTVQKTDKAFIKFTGAVQEAMAQVDNGEPFPIVVITDDSEVNPLRQIAPGKHTVSVVKGDVQVVNKLIFVGTHETVEVYVP